MSGPVSLCVFGDVSTRRKQRQRKTQKEAVHSVHANHPAQRPAALLLDRLIVGLLCCIARLPLASVTACHKRGRSKPEAPPTAGLDRCVSCKPATSHARTTGRRNLLLCETPVRLRLPSNSSTFDSMG